MTEVKNGKRNALLGGLIVFLIPILAVSIVYFTASRLPKGKQLPVLQKAEAVGDYYFENNGLVVEDGTYWKDVKVVFWMNNLNYQQLSEKLSKLTQFAEVQPPFSLKDPYPQLYLLAVTEEEDIRLLEQFSDFLIPLQAKTFSPAIADKNTIYLLDRLDNIRGEYQFTPDDIDALYGDAQYLLQDTFYENADTLRIKRMFKTELDEQ